MTEEKWKAGDPLKEHKDRAEMTVLIRELQSQVAVLKHDGTEIRERLEAVEGDCLGTEGSQEKIGIEDTFRALEERLVAVEAVKVDDIPIVRRIDDDVRRVRERLEAIGEWVAEVQGFRQALGEVRERLEAVEGDSTREITRTRAEEIAELRQAIIETREVVGSMDQRGAVKELTTRVTELEGRGDRNAFFEAIEDKLSHVLKIHREDRTRLSTLEDRVEMVKLTTVEHARRLDRRPGYEDSEHIETVVSELSGKVDTLVAADLDKAQRLERIEVLLRRSETEETLGALGKPELKGTIDNDRPPSESVPAPSEAPPTCSVCGGLWYKGHVCDRKKTPAELASGPGDLYWEARAREGREIRNDIVGIREGLHRLKDEAKSGAEVTKDKLRELDDSVYGTIHERLNKLEKSENLAEVTNIAVRLRVMEKAITADGAIETAAKWIEELGLAPTAGLVERVDRLEDRVPNCGAAPKTWTSDISDRIRDCRDALVGFIPDDVIELTTSVRDRLDHIEQVIADDRDGFRDATEKNHAMLKSRIEALEQHGEQWNDFSPDVHIDDRCEPHAPPRKDEVSLSYAEETNLGTVPKPGVILEQVVAWPEIHKKLDAIMAAIEEIPRPQGVIDAFLDAPIAEERKAQEKFGARVKALEAWAHAEGDFDPAGFPGTVATEETESGEEDHGEKEKLQYLTPKLEALQTAEAVEDAKRKIERTLLIEEEEKLRPARQARQGIPFPTHREERQQEKRYQEASEALKPCSCETRHPIAKSRSERRGFCPVCGGAE